MHHVMQQHPACPLPRQPEQLPFRAVPHAAGMGLELKLAPLKLVPPPSRPCHKKQRQQQPAEQGPELVEQRRLLLDLQQRLQRCRQVEQGMGVEHPRELQGQLDSMAEKWEQVRAADRAAWERKRLRQHMEWEQQRAAQQREWEEQRAAQQREWERHRELEQALWDRWWLRQQLKAATPRPAAAQQEAQQGGPVTPLHQKRKRQEVEGAECRSAWSWGSADAERSHLGAASDTFQASAARWPEGSIELSSRLVASPTMQGSQKAAQASPPQDQHVGPTPAPVPAWLVEQLNQAGQQQPGQQEGLPLKPQAGQQPEVGEDEWRELEKLALEPLMEEELALLRPLSPTLQAASPVACSFASAEAAGLCVEQGGQEDWLCSLLA